MRGRHATETPTPQAAFSQLSATRGLGLFLCGGGAYMLWRSVVGWDVTGHPFSSYAGASFGATLLAIGLAVLWSYLYAARIHPNEPMEFWRRAEVRWRGKIIGGLVVVGASATVVFMFALATYPSLAGAMVGPALWGDFIGIASVTGGIRPLFPK